MWYLFIWQIPGDGKNDAKVEENNLENENGLIDIDKLSPIHGTPIKSCDRVDGDGTTDCWLRGCSQG